MEPRKYPIIGVEPVMFFYMAAFMTTSVVEESFFIFKACSVDLGYPLEICHNISNPAYKNYSTNVQVKVSEFHQYQNIAAYGIPVILAFFVGAWSDRVGRKIPLMLGLIGSLIYSIMIIVNSLNDTWSVYVILFTATLPCAMSGAMLTVFMACFAYISDTTTQENRTIRVTLLEVVYLLPMPLGVAFGSYLFNGPLYRSYEKLFAVNAALMSCAIIYSYFFIARKTVEKQGPARICSQFGETLQTLTAQRTEHRRLILILALVAMVLYTLQRDEKRMTQLYTMKKFNWGVPEFSNLKTFQSSFYILGLLVTVPVLKNLFHIREVYIIVIGAISHVIARVIFILAETPTFFYLGASCSLVGPNVVPILRSITSKLVPTSERGKVFALFSLADTTAPLVSGFVFSQVYIHTFETPFPGAIFLVSAVSQTIVLIIALIMNRLLKGKNLLEAKEETDEIETFQ